MEDLVRDVVSLIPIFETVDIKGTPLSILINFNDLYGFIKRLGNGGSGIVNCYQEISTGNLYAFKEIVVTDYKQLNNLRTEVDVLCRLSDVTTSSSIVKYHSSFITKSDATLIFIIATEYIEGLDLESYLHQIIDKKSFIDMSTILRISYWLFDTLSLLHSNGFVHRDIKPNNIMIDTTNRRLVLIDFGLTCLVKAKKGKYLTCDSGTFNGTTVFMPPESINVNKSIKSKFDKLKSIDIWAAGITIYLLTENALPWSGNIIEQITGSYQIPYKRSREIGDILNLCLRKNPTDRGQALNIRDQIASLISSKYFKSTSPASPQVSSV